MITILYILLFENDHAHIYVELIITFL